MSKIALAYSGGLDSVVSLHWLTRRGHEVTTFTAQLGGHRPAFADQAIANGAKKAIVKDLREHWIATIATAARQLDAVYGKYLLHVALSKIAVAEHMGSMAYQEGITILSHGAHSGENDYYRLNNFFETIAEKLGVEFVTFIPWEDPEFRAQFPNREALLAYVEAYKMQSDKVGATTLTSEPTLLGINYENGDLVHYDQPASGILEYSYPKSKTPCDVTFHFEKGHLSRLDGPWGKQEGIMSILGVLDPLGRQMGIGVIDVVEPNIDGSKARCVYIQPATSLWHEAHMELGNMILSNKEIARRNFIGHRAGELIYHGQWFSKEMEHLKEEAVDYNQRYNGWVKLRLYPGFARVIGRKAFS